MKLPRWFHQLGSPPYVYRLANRLCPWLGGLGVVLLVVGAVWGLVIAPSDYQQDEVYRIIYIHPQTAYVGMMAYVVMAVAAGIGFIWRLKLAHAVAVSAAPIGAWFTFCALFTGAVACATTSGDIEAPPTLTVIDYSLPSTEPRMWVFDMKTGELLFKESSNGR